MVSNVASWFPVLRSHLSASLVSGQAFERVRDVARWIPETCLCAIEVRLGAGEPDVDFSVRLRDRAEVRALTPRLSPPHVARFLERWAESCFELQPVRSVWLEFDLDRQSCGHLEPIVCVELEGPPNAEWLIDHLIPGLDGGPTSPARGRLIRRILEVTRAPAELLYVFGLGARGCNATRLEFHRASPQSMVGILRALDQHDAAGRVAALGPVVDGCDRYHLSFDVGEAIMSRIGIEASFRRLPGREPGWLQLFDRLIDQGLCSRSKKEAAFRWPGWDSAATAPHQWPENPPRPRTFCARCLSHVKLVSSPAIEPEAKAYLLFAVLDNGDTSLEVRTPSCSANARA